MDKIVSFIAPFYNAERYLKRFLDSILVQTYKKIQIILVDDGSNDGSNDIVNSYIEILNASFYELIYLKKENGGAASAVNDALKYVTGEYLSWADCDDELMPTNIEEKVRFLESNRDYGLVICGAEAVDQETGKKIHDLIIPLEKRKDNMFKTIIDGIPVYSGVFMVRSDLLFEQIANREIYFTPEAGQNFQLTLPVAFFHKCGFIDSILYRYYVRKDSHSHDVDYKKAYERTYIREILISNVVSFMPEVEKVELMDEIYSEERRKRFNMSFRFADIETNDKDYIEMKKANEIITSDRIRHILIHFPQIYRIMRKYL